MKKLLFMLLISTVTMSTTCSKYDDRVSGSTVISSSQVPSGVMSNFNTRYPAATGQIEWERENGNTYKVKFFIGSQRTQAIFASDGSFISEKNI